MPQWQRYVRGVHAVEVSAGLGTPPHTDPQTPKSKTGVADYRRPPSRAAPPAPPPPPPPPRFTIGLPTVAACSSAPPAPLALPPCVVVQMDSSPL